MQQSTIIKTSKTKMHAQGNQDKKQDKAKPWKRDDKRERFKPQ